MDGGTADKCLSTPHCEKETDEQCDRESDQPDWLIENDSEMNSSQSNRKQPHDNGTDTADPFQDSSEHRQLFTGGAYLFFVLTTDPDKPLSVVTHHANSTGTVGTPPEHEVAEQRIDDCGPNEYRQIDYRELPQSDAVLHRLL
jgi:hypothetical protein